MASYTQEHYRLPKTLSCLGILQRSFTSHVAIAVCRQQLRNTRVLNQRFLEQLGQTRGVAPRWIYQSIPLTAHLKQTDFLFVNVLVVWSRTVRFYFTLRIVTILSPPVCNLFPLIGCSLGLLSSNANLFLVISARRDFIISSRWANINDCLVPFFYVLPYFLGTFSFVILFCNIRMWLSAFASQTSRM
jgi:hypothetical protein